MSAAQNLLDDQKTFITDLQNESRTAQFNAQNAVMQSRPGQVTPVTVTIPPPYKLTEPPPPPHFDPIDLGLPNPAPGMGEFVVLSEVNQDITPVFEVPPPHLDFGTTPNQLPEFAEQTPNISTNFVFPEPPGALGQIIQLPTISQRDEPQAPNIATVDFDSLAPVNDAQAPADVAGTYRASYADMSNTMTTVVNGLMDDYLNKFNPQYHSQLAATEKQLTKYLAGGTGLKSEVEDAIYARGQKKNDVEAKRVQDAAFADAAARGFTLPSGALASTLARARQDAANLNAAKVNEIIVMQAEIEQKNLQFAVTTSAALRATAIASMISYMQGAISITGMALEYAKGILGAIVNVYDIQVKSFSLKLEAYKAAATVYEVKVRASVQAVEIYKTRIQALEAMTNVDRSKVDMYKAQIDSMKALSDLYKTQIEAVVSKASLEKLKIELFQSQVQAYAAQVQAKSAEWQGYQARLAGEESKAKIFGSQVDAFNAQIAAYKAKTEGISEKIKSESAKNNAVIQQYVAGVSSYETGVRAAAAVASANIDIQRQELSGYQGMVSFAVAQANMAVDAYKANVGASESNAKLNMDMQVANVTSGLGQMKALSDVHQEILKIYSGPASAAAAGMNSLASINHDE